MVSFRHALLIVRVAVCRCSWFEDQSAQIGTRLDPQTFTRIHASPIRCFLSGLKIGNSLSRTPAGMYHLHYRGENHGPYLIDQIKTMWATGIITADAVYWNEATEAWEPVAELLKPSLLEVSDRPKISPLPVVAISPTVPTELNHEKNSPKERSLLRKASGCLYKTILLTIIGFTVLVGLVAYLEYEKEKEAKYQEEMAKVVRDAQTTQTPVPVLEPEAPKPNVPPNQKKAPLQPTEWATKEDVTIRIDKEFAFNGKLIRFGDEFPAGHQTRIDESGTVQQRFQFHAPWGRDGGRDDNPYFLTPEWAHVVRQATSDGSDIYKRASPSVAILELVRPDSANVGIGSGFVVAPNIVVTNFHVVKGWRDGRVTFVGQKRSFPITKLLAEDQVHDLALVQINAPDVPPLLLAGDDPPEVGSHVWVIGSPVALQGTLSDGTVSRLAPELVQFTAPISHGSSGGPVLNSKGQVIGVTVAFKEGGQNLNFAVPIRFLKALLTPVAP